MYRLVYINRAEQNVANTDKAVVRSADGKIFAPRRKVNVTMTCCHVTDFAVCHLLSFLCE